MRWDGNKPGDWIALTPPTKRQTKRPDVINTSSNTGKKRFCNTIRKGKERVLRAQEQKLQTGTNVQGVIFSMKNNYNWVDKQEVTGKDGKELPSAINISFGREESED